MEIFNAIRGTLQEMQGIINANTRDLKAMEARVQMMASRSEDLSAAVSRLEGTFASIEQIFLDHEKRISALEKGRPPAA